MSRSNNNELVNPAVKFFDWSGSTGNITFYDKELKENITVDLPFKFLILDRVSQITGGIDRDGSYSGFWSNAVRNLKIQSLTVRSKQGIEAQGLYEHIKGTPGVKYMTGLYVGFYGEDKTMQIGYLKIKGAALTAWIDFTKSHKDIYAGAFGITGAEKRKKGTTVYYEPVFEHYATVAPESDEVAKMLDVQLQEYLTAYFAQAGIAEVEAEYSGSGNDEIHTSNGQVSAMLNSPPEKAATATANANASYLNNSPDQPPSNLVEPPDGFVDHDNIPF